MSLTLAIPSSGINIGQPVRRDSALNERLKLWYLCLPDASNHGFHWRDLCGVHHGTLTNMSPHWRSAIGRPGGWGSLEFANDGGTNDRVVVSNPDCDMVTNRFTAAMWVYPHGFGSSLSPNLIDFYSTEGWLWRISQGTPTWHQFVSVAGGAQEDNTYSISTNAWQHLAVVCTGSAVWFYHNGRTSSSKSLTTNAPSTGQAVSIGNRDDADRDFDGCLDDVRFWDRCLSSEDIKGVYEDSRTGYWRTLNRVSRSWFVGSGAGVSAITGTSDMVFGAGSSTLTGSGALAGSAAMVFGAGSATLAGAGVLAGAAAATFGAGSSTLTGSGALAGTAAMVFGATLLSTGAISGTSDLVFGSGSSTLIGAGALAGPAVSIFGAGSSTLAGSGALAGTASFSFGSGISTLLGTGTLTGTAAIAFTGSGAAAAAGVMAGVAAMAFAATMGDYVYGLCVEAVAITTPFVQAAQITTPFVEAVQTGCQ